MRRLKATVAAVIAVLTVTALVLVPDPTMSTPDPIATSAVDAPPPARIDAQLVAESNPDPCADYDALEAGAGEPVRQDWFNHLDARGYARYRMACKYAWGTSEWECLDSLWSKESGWNHTIRHGIPQFMPESKIIDLVGPNYRELPRKQVVEGLAYIDTRYGTPNRANFHEHTHYGSGCHAGY